MLNFSKSLQYENALKHLYDVIIDTRKTKSFVLSFFFFGCTYAISSRTFLKMYKKLLPGFTYRKFYLAFASHLLYYVYPAVKSKSSIIGFERFIRNPVLLGLSYEIK